MLCKTLQNSFDDIQVIIHKNFGLECTNYKAEVESQEYGACSFNLGSYFVRFRIAKITPTKIGQFVTLWKRIGNGPIMPYDTADAIDFFMVMAQTDKNCGFFLFPKNVLKTKGVISIDGKGGKRAIRIYPLWDVTDSKQAQATQKWQAPYFLKLQSDGSIDSVMLAKLATIFG
jgi:hypothetical protein